jgi:hypothetical protein
MKPSVYQQAKTHLKNASVLYKNSYKGDKPAIRQAINNTLDSIIKDTINCPRLRVSEAKREQYRNWLSDYACTLHP